MRKNPLTGALKTPAEVEPVKTVMFISMRAFVHEVVNGFASVETSTRKVMAASWS